MEGLYQVIVGSARKAAHAVGLAGAARHEDHRQLGIDARGGAVRGPHPIEQVQAVPLAEPEVQQHERRVPDLYGPNALGRAGRAGHSETVGSEVVGEERAGGLVVLHDQE